MTNKKFFVVVLEWCHCENLQSVSVQIRGNPKVNLRLNLWIATLALLARNDGQRKRILSFYNDSELCHFEPLQKATQRLARRKPKQKIYIVILSLL